ncbi:ABC transporter ATP-binding protein [Micromonospora sp. NPDC050980]|uniref:ABC transporter ATP-binding protein n=1 Tax=Micromonospora sp. NPDC050980 TaxID=3155161 RepID=UPI0033EFEB4A
MRLDGVWLRYHRHGPWVLRQVDVAIGAGEVAVVLGRNGAGKSTLLQLAAGVLRPSRGTVTGRPAAVGWVPERFGADQPFTVGAYLAAMGRVAGLPGPAADRAVRHWVERLGLTRFHDVRLPQLSKGTAQKVGLAQALLRPPGLLVLDEPWEGLDAAARELVPEMIGEVLAGGGAVLVSDHRGETVRLPGARQWSVVDGTLGETAPSEGSAVAVVELAVPAVTVVATVARLRADGHQVLRIRDHAVPTPATPPGQPVATPPDAESTLSAGVRPDGDQAAGSDDRSRVSTGPPDHPGEVSSDGPPGLLTGGAAEVGEGVGSGRSGSATEVDR